MTCRPQFTKIQEYYFAIRDTRPLSPQRPPGHASDSEVPGRPQPPFSWGAGHSPPLSHTAVSPSHMPLGRHCRTGEPRRVRPSSHWKLRLPPTGWDPSRGVNMPFSKETGAGQRTAGGREGEGNIGMAGKHLGWAWMRRHHQLAVKRWGCCTCRHCCGCWRGTGTVSQFCLTDGQPLLSAPEGHGHPSPSPGVLRCRVSGQLRG